MVTRRFPDLQRKPTRLRGDGVPQQKRGKWPFLRFATGDYWNDPGVQSLDHWDKGVWLEILFLMHQSEERGKLVLNGRAMSDPEIARALGLQLNGVEYYEAGEFSRPLSKTLATIMEKAIATRDENGALTSRRMVKDTALHDMAVETGRRGGSPLLKGYPPQGAQNNGVQPQRPPPPPQPEAIQSAAPGEVPQFETEQARRERLKRERDNGGGAPPQPGARGTQATRMHKDWQIGPELATWIRENAPGITKPEVDRLRAEFIDFWLGVPGKDGYKLDWDATFRNKFRKYLDNRGGYRRGNGEKAGNGRIDPGEFLKNLDAEEGQEGPGEDAQ